MTDTKPQAEHETDDESAQARVERLIDEILQNRGGAQSGFFDIRISDLRCALDAAAKDSVWDVVDRTFGMIAAVSTEMAVRATVALRKALDRHDAHPGAELFPPVNEHAERVQRIAHFTLDCATKYAKVRHLTTIAKRGDPKIVSFEDARKKADTTKGRRNATRKSKEAVEA